MKPHAGRIAVLTLIMAGVAIAVVLMPVWAARHRAAPVKLEAWIPMQMDGGAPQRWASGREFHKYMGSFSDRCATYSAGSGPSEEYSIAIGEIGHSTIAQHWRIDLVPSGDAMDVAIHIAAPHPRPSLSASASSAASSVGEQDRMVHYRMSLKDMQPIREVLMSPDLWPQYHGYVDCLIGPEELTLEACVHGQYFVRMPISHCFTEASDRQLRKLDDLLRQRFPQPTVGR